MRAVIDAAKMQTLQRQIAAAHPATVVTIEVYRNDWEAPFRTFRVATRRADHMIRHCQRLANATSVRVRVDNGLWFDVPLHHSSSITAA
jgi:hypothetical protein